MYSIPEIRLRRSPSGWVAQFVNDREILAVMGTDTIPTAFTAQADPITVLRAIQRLNPHHLVTLPV